MTPQEVKKLKPFQLAAQVEFPGRIVRTRQRLYQLRRQRENRCLKCGRPGAPYCEAHLIAHAQAQARRYRRKKGIPEDESFQEPSPLAGTATVLADLSRRLAKAVLGR